ncbi:hypothetical protein IQ07DRAFT_182570 [Pyrenochaeta sp. DS3sAY3a]|nr:hypothetical protein IQ07DRAFT_182570 [Pyrenochaeta sp. DS3sAY3a]
MTLDSYRAGLELKFYKTIATKQLGSVSSEHIRPRDYLYSGPSTTAKPPDWRLRTSLEPHLVHSLGSIQLARPDCAISSGKDGAIDSATGTYLSERRVARWIDMLVRQARYGNFGYRQGSFSIGSESVYPSLLACRRDIGPASLARQVPVSTTAASAVTRHPPQRSLPARVRPPRFTTPRELAILRQLASLSSDALLPPCDAVGADFFLQVSSAITPASQV